MSLRSLAVRGSLLVFVAGTGLLACFSERSSVTPPEEDLCDGTARANVVVIRTFAFEPAQLQVSPGTRVTWVNCDSDGHTSTSDAGVWNSPLLSRNMTFSHTFDQAGSFPYHCAPHPFMVATVVVQ